VGGIETPADAALRMENGATLIQGYTGWIYQGPLWARSINKFLTK
jgi:dihydroorotate dehydrogenase